MVDEKLNYRSMGRNGIRVVNDDGKRWRLESVDGKWSMRPEGFISAAEAQDLCERAFAALSPSTPAGSVTVEEIARVINENLHPSDPTVDDAATAVFALLQSKAGTA